MIRNDPAEQQCGWLRMFGLFLQLILDGTGAVMNDPNTARHGRAFAAVLQMKVNNLDALRRAAEGWAAHPASQRVTER